MKGERKARCPKALRAQGAEQPLAPRLAADPGTAGKELDGEQ
jgi:hypothetical protein